MTHTGNVYTKLSLPGSVRLRCGIVIPVYNASPHLEELLLRIEKVARENPNVYLEVILVDDGSQPPVKEFGASHTRVKVLRHPCNQGKGAALRLGFDYFLKRLEVGCVLTMDADLQHPPEYIPFFLNTFLKNDHRIIVGYRQRLLRVMPFHRILSNSITSLIISALIGQKIRDSQCGFRLYAREVLQGIQLSEDRFHLESEALIRSGWRRFRIGFVPVPTIYNGSPSSIKNIRDTWNFLYMLFRLLKERIRGHV